MIIIQETVISMTSPILFVCNLGSLQGACCVEGDSASGPRLKILEQGIRQHQALLHCHGRIPSGPGSLHQRDWEGDFHHDRDDKGAPTLWTKRGILKCGIERAYQAGATTFKAHISCHHSTQFITRLKGSMRWRYDQWGICSPAARSAKRAFTFQFLKAADSQNTRGWYRDAGAGG
jgi:hypothetical protein